MYCSSKACETLSCQNTAYFTGNNLFLTPFSIHTDSGSNKPPIIIAVQLRKPREGMPVEVRVRLEWNCLQSSVNLYSLSSGCTRQLSNSGQEVGPLTYSSICTPACPHIYTQAHVNVINSLCIYIVHGSVCYCKLWLPSWFLAKTEGWVTELPFFGISTYSLHMVLCWGS